MGVSHSTCCTSPPGSRWGRGGRGRWISQPPPDPQGTSPLTTGQRFLLHLHRGPLQRPPQRRLQSHTTGQSGEQTLKSTIRADLNHHQTRIPDHLRDTPNIMNLFLTPNTSAYFVKLFLYVGFLPS
ncbi:hypothetical protein E2C01_047335 [Portunus trituberculatus]|uniref:Uncharacterized protein n=1 Tax=Portunus trituberculatus TaxID=210409 RepID=A0A5B7GA79_PORTR|nr:hypothetical protein [Portunus trituberculatus]